MTVVLPSICEDEVVDLPPVRAVYKRVKRKKGYRSLMSSGGSAPMSMSDNDEVSTYNLLEQENERLKKKIENLQTQVLARDEIIQRRNEEARQKDEEMSELQSRYDQLFKFYKQKEHKK